MLKARRYRGQATLILEEGESGTFSILEEWTDKAAPTAQAAHLLLASALQELVQLVQRLKASSQQGVDTCA